MYRSYRAAPSNEYNNSMDRYVPLSCTMNELPMVRNEDQYLIYRIHYLLCLRHSALTPAGRRRAAATAATAAATATEAGRSSLRLRCHWNQVINGRSSVGYPLPCMNEWHPMC